MDIFSVVLNFFLITILGFLIAFSPMIVIVNVLVILKSKRPILRTLVLMAGMAAPLIIVSVLAYRFLEPNSQVSLRGITDKISIPPLFDLALGVWLASLAIKRWQYSKQHDKPKKSADLIMKKPPDKLSGLFGFAFIKSTLSATNIFAVLVVAKTLITHSIDEPLAAIIILWVILVGLLPFLIILYLYFFKHERLELLSDQVDKLLNRNLDFAITLILGLAGSFFCLQAILGFLHK